MKYVLLFILTLLFLDLVGCLTDAELAAFKPVNASYVDPHTNKSASVKAYNEDADTQVISVNGIPSHPTWIFPQAGGNPHKIQVVNKELRIYKTPRMRSEPLRCIPLGSIGFATSGVSIDGWFAAEKNCPTAEEFEELDICEGHPSPDGQYHYHHYSPCVQMPTCEEPSTIWGVAIDGIPIYGPIDEDGRQLTKSDLDECGGKKDSSGRYKYHMTVDPPYSMGCFWGEIRSDVGLNDRAFDACTCPFDDNHFRRPKPGMGEGPPGPPPDGGKGGPIAFCELNSTNTSEPAICSNNYNHSYVMEVTWEYPSKEINLAPCCPKGSDCGASCKTEEGIKSVCKQEKRTVKFKTRIQREDSDKSASPFSVYRAHTGTLLFCVFQLFSVFEYFLFFGH